MAARDALEARLRRSVPPVHGPAGDARSTRVAGSTSTTGTPASRALYCTNVRNWPNDQLLWRLLQPSNRVSVADAVEVFKGYAATGAFGGAYQFIADAVIGVLLVALLAAAAQQPQPEPSGEVLARFDVCSGPT